jgi:tetratricopeptide (TPR) repeat protein
VFTTEAARKGSSIALRLAIALHDGNNTVGIDGLTNPADGASIPFRHWSTHIYVKGDQEPDQFAILLKGQSDSAVDNDVEAVRTQLNKAGIVQQNLLVAKTRAELDEALNKVRGKSGSRDKLLIYFRGRGTVSTAEGEPVLLMSSDPSAVDAWLPISELSRETTGLPPVSYALDITFQSGLADPFIHKLSGESETPQRPNSDQRAFGWLHSIAPASESEIVFSNPFGNKKPGAVTRLMLSGVSTRPDNGCTTLAEVGQSIASKVNYSQITPDAVYLTNARSYPSFCISPSNISTNGLLVNVSRYSFPDPFMVVAQVEATIPTGIASSWREVLIDGVVVRRASRSESHDKIGNKILQLVSLTEGPHIVEVRLGTASKIIASGRTTFDMVFPPIVNRLEAEDLNADILRPITPRSITSSGFFTIGFIVADKKADSVHYELRNNGVVVLRGVAGGRKVGQNLEILRRIPVSVGENNIVIEVRRDNETRSARCLVIRRVEQPLRAVIIGPDQVDGQSQLHGVQADVESMKRVLLNYTDLNPRNLVTLAGNKATGAAIREAILNSNTIHLSDPMIQGGSDETFLLYFSGYGTTLLDGAKKPIARCILAADVESSADPKQCISTTEIDHMLDAHNNAIVIFDTSYDGLSGASQKDVTKGFFSRTVGDYLSSDVDWRVSAGTDRANRVFIVGSKTNTAALESASPPQGLFTSSLVEAIEEQTGPMRPSQGAQLFDVFASARTKTILKSAKNQTPLIKGSLSTEFYFKLRSADDLATEARAIDLGIFDDLQSLRRIDPNELDRAESLYEVVLALRPNDFEAQQGKVRLLIYRGDFDSAEAIVSSALTAEASSVVNSPEVSGWYLLRSVLRMRRGDISGALSDCERAKRDNPKSALVLSLLPKLYFAIADYKKSAALTSELANRAAELSHDLTDDEWAHVLLLGYIAMRRSNDTAASAAWLKRHFSSYVQVRSVPAALTHALLVGPKSLVGLSQSSDVIKVRSPWFQLAADFLLEPQAGADSSSLSSFNDRNSAFDAKDPQAIEFMTHFYKGMKLLVENSRDAANMELNLALQTNQKQFAEFWIAQAECNRMQ